MIVKQTFGETSEKEVDVKRDKAEKFWRETERDMMMVIGNCRSSSMMLTLVDFLMGAIKSRSKNCQM
jgi:hypothetical protein